MQAGIRIAVDEKKRHPMDFVLWKGAKPGEPQWSSPWGPGRPGWHIECSVMSSQYLGTSFDIHGGGEDLLFPHHENELAQSVAANGGDFARYWVHNGFVTVESEKMAKSLGNFLTIRDALQEYHPQVLRLFLLSKHYRSPLDFSKADVLSLQSGLVRIYRALQRLEDQVGVPEAVSEPFSPAPLADGQQDPFLAEFIEVMDDDLNTAGAIGLLFEKTKDINKIIESGGGPEKLRTLKDRRRQLLAAAGVLGLLQDGPGAFFEALSSHAKEAMDTGEIERMVEERAEARAKKEWQRADDIRNQLKKLGVVLEDTPKGTTWRLDV
jgi:cysteinyl-tRNA synthetase